MGKKSNHFGNKNQANSVPFSKKRHNPLDPSSIKLTSDY